MNPPLADFPTDIKAMHVAFERLTNTKLVLEWCRADAWRIFLKWRTPPFTAEDMALVVAHIRKGIKDGKRNPGALRFSNLIVQVDMFEETLNMTLIELRPKKQTTKTIKEGGFSKVVQDDGTGESTVSLGDVIAAMRRAAG